MIQKLKDCSGIDNCIKIFITWQAGLLYVLGLIVILASIAWAGSARFTKLEMRIENTEKAIVMIYSINSKIDSLLKK